MPKITYYLIHCIFVQRHTRVASSSKIIVALYATAGFPYRNHRQTRNDVFPHRWLPLRLRERDMDTCEK